MSFLWKRCAIAYAGTCLIVSASSVHVYKPSAFQVFRMLQTIIYHKIKSFLIKDQHIYKIKVTMIDTEFFLSKIILS